MIKLIIGQPLSIKKKSDQASFDAPRKKSAVAARTAILFARLGAVDVIPRLNISQRGAARRGAVQVFS